MIQLDNEGELEIGFDNKELTRLTLKTFEEHADFYSRDIIPDGKCPPPIYSFPVTYLLTFIVNHRQSTQCW